MNSLELAKWPLDSRHFFETKQHARPSFLGSYFTIVFSFFLSLFFFCVSRCRNLLKIEFSCVILLRPFISSYSTRSTFEKLLQPKRRGLIFKSKYEIRNSHTFARANYVLRSKRRDIFFFFAYSLRTIDFTMIEDDSSRQYGLTIIIQINCKFFQNLST